MPPTTLTNTHGNTLAIAPDVDAPVGFKSLYLKPAGYDGDAVSVAHPEHYATEIDKWVRRGILKTGDEPVKDVVIPVSVQALTPPLRELATALAMGTPKQFDAAVTMVAMDNPPNLAGDIDRDYMANAYTQALLASVDWIEARGRNHARIKRIRDRIKKIASGKMEP